MAVAASLLLPLEPLCFPVWTASSSSDDDWGLWQPQTYQSGLFPARGTLTAVTTAEEADSKL